ncbi:MAG: SAM-dependent methyltransferase [Chlamydiales bacterium]|nr:SAM-dependent methyltransferase [Chlamydiales bacterium]
MTAGRLYLLPNVLDDTQSYTKFMPSHVAEIIATLDGVICESEKPARRFLGQFKKAQLPLALLNEHTKADELAVLLDPVIKGQVWGILSDAGLPCIADPGAQLVRLARQKNVPVEAIVGPSSLFMALMLSGFSGQHFSFHGYLPRERDQRKSRLQSLEQKSRKENSSELFIEAPYRNQELLQSLVDDLQPTTELAVAVDLTSPTQEVHVKAIKEWRKEPLPQINKRPTVFILFGHK